MSHLQTFHVFRASLCPNPVRVVQPSCASGIPPQNNRSSQQLFDPDQCVMATPS